MNGSPEVCSGTDVPSPRVISTIFLRAVDTVGRFSAVAVLVGLIEVAEARDRGALGRGREPDGGAS